MALTADRRLRAVIARFQLSGEPVSASVVPGGHINESWRVECRADGRVSTYLLQRLNPSVFPDPVAVMENIVRVTRHCAARRSLVLRPTLGGGWWHRDEAGDCWRVYDFIEGAHVRERAESPALAREAAAAFGVFLRLMADYDGPALHETLPGFHDTAARFARLEDAARRDPMERLAGARGELDGLLAHRALADVLPPLLASGAVPVRIAHHDAKIANVLFDDAEGTALAVIDLDTVMPGSALYDFGDLVRSVVSPTDEDETDLARIRVRRPFFEAVAQGYLAEAGSVLVPKERELLAFAGRLITLEQAVRFLTDHLEGDRYYRVARPGHNLDRARAQIALLGSLLVYADEMDAIIARAPR